MCLEKWVTVCVQIDNRDEILSLEAIQQWLYCPQAPTCRWQMLKVRQRAFFFLYLSVYSTCEQTFMHVWLLCDTVGRVGCLLIPVDTSGSCIDQQNPELTAESLTLYPHRSRALSELSWRWKLRGGILHEGLRCLKTAWGHVWSVCHFPVLAVQVSSHHLFRKSLYLQETYVGLSNKLKCVQ